MQKWCLGIYVITLYDHSLSSCSAFICPNKMSVLYLQQNVLMEVLTDPDLRGLHMLYISSQAFDVPGVSEYAEASNMVRNRIFYGEIRSIDTSYLNIENTVSDYCIF